eukprot:EG_transcript_31145
MPSFSVPPVQSDQSDHLHSADFLCCSNSMHALFVQPFILGSALVVRLTSLCGPFLNPSLTPSLSCPPPSPCLSIKRLPLPDTTLHWGTGQLEASFLCGAPVAPQRNRGPIAPLLALSRQFHAIPGWLPLISQPFDLTGRPGNPIGPPWGRWGCHPASDSVCSAIC